MNEFLDSVMKAAMEKPLPPLAAAYHLDGLRRLVALCAELQRLAGDRPFFLTCRDAARLVGLGDQYQLANKWMWRLKHDGLLEQVAKGNDERASRWRYTPPPSSADRACPPGSVEV